MDAFSRMRAPVRHVWAVWLWPASQLSWSMVPSGWVTASPHPRSLWLPVLIRPLHLPRSTWPNSAPLQHQALHTIWALWATATRLAARALWELSSDPSLHSLSGCKPITSGMLTLCLRAGSSTNEIATSGAAAAGLHVARAARPPRWLRRRDRWWWLGPRRHLGPLASGRLVPAKVVGTVSASEFFVTVTAVLVRRLTSLPPCRGHSSGVPSPRLHSSSSPASTLLSCQGFMAALGSHVGGEGVRVDLVLGCWRVARGARRSFLVTNLEPRLLGVIVGGFVLLTNLQTLLRTATLSGQAAVAANTAVGVLWATAVSNVARKSMIKGQDAADEFAVACATPLPSDAAPVDEADEDDGCHPLVR